MKKFLVAALVALAIFAGTMSAQAQQLSPYQQQMRAQLAQQQAYYNFRRRQQLIGLGAGLVGGLLGGHRQRVVLQSTCLQWTMTTSGRYVCTVRTTPVMVRTYP